MRDRNGDLKMTSVPLGERWLSVITLVLGRISRDTSLA